MDQPQNKEEEYKFENPEDTGSQATSIKEIILRQYNKCVTEGSKEMNIGGVRKRVIDGQITEIAIPNQIEIFINSVKMLRLLLKSYEEKEKKLIGDTMKEITGKHNKLIEGHNQEIGKIAKAYRPQNERWVKKNYRQHNERLNNCNMSLEKEKVEIYAEYLSAMGTLLNKLNYFDDEKDFN